MTATGASLEACMWHEGLVTNLEISVGPSNVANDINDKGQVVGWMGVAPSQPFPGEAFVWENGVTTPLGFPKDGINSEAHAINNHGDISGDYSIPVSQGQNNLKHAIVWSKGEMITLGTLPGYSWSRANDINDAGIVVGLCSESSIGNKAFIWRDGKMTALQDLLPPDSQIVAIQNAMAINNAGQITGRCTVDGANDTYSAAFLLTPMPSPIGDFNCDSTIDVDDLLGVINHWADTPMKGSIALPPADFNQDSIVDHEDLMIVLDNWTF